MRAGIAIVGGGMVGAWVASELARRADPLRAPVVLFEAGPLEDCAPARVPLVGGSAEDGPLRPALVDGARAIEQFETLVGRGIGFGRPGWLLLGVGASDGGDLSAPAYSLGMDESALEGALWLPDAGTFDPVRLHAEVLGLGRTRGMVTRQGVRVEALVRDASGRIIGLETSRGSVEVEAVLIADPAAASRLAPGLGFIFETSERPEVRLRSPLFAGPHAPLGSLRGSSHELFEVAADPESLDAFFGAGEALEFPHPALSTADLDVMPDALMGELVVAAAGAIDLAGLRGRLAQLASVFGELGEPSLERRVVLTMTPSRRPVLADLGGGLFVGLALGLHEAQLAAGLAPGLVALLHGEPVAAFDPAAFAPGPTRRERS